MLLGIEQLYKIKENNLIKTDYSKMEFLPFVVDTHKKMFNETFVVKNFHEEMSELLTKCALRQVDNGYIFIINMPPRFSKTQYLSYYVMWCFLKNPMARFIYATYSQKLSLKISREIKAGLTKTYGQKSKLSKDSAELWETYAGGGFWSATINGAVTGFGCGDLYATPYGGDLIIDDPQKPSDAFYETYRQGVIENFSQTFWSRRNNLDKTPIILLQQRVHTDDLSGWLMRDSKFRYTSYCVKALDDNGKSVFPERVSTETLLELKQASPYTFAAQQQQSPQAFTGNFFLVDKTQIISVKEFREKEWLMGFWVRSWDLAGVRKETKPSDKRDFTRGVLMCTDGEFAYIVDVKTHKGTVEGNDTLIAQTAKIDGVKVYITIPEDPGAAGQHYVDYLQNLRELKGYSLNPVRPTQNKQLRAAPFAAFLNSGKVKIVSDDEDVEKWNAPLLAELASFPFSKNDDMCFIAGTKISTSIGDVNIENITTNHKVITPLGLCKVKACGLTGYNNVISKKGLIGTSGHPIFTNNSFIRLDALTDESITSTISLGGLIKWRYLMLLYLMESNINLWEERRDIISVGQKTLKKERVLRDYMWRFGNFIAAKQFQKALLFTIKTVIILITVMKIWNVYRLRNTLKNIGKTLLNIVTAIKVKRTLKKQLNCQKSGTPQTKVMNGILNTLINLFSKNKKKHVLNANQYLSGTQCQYIAQKNVITKNTQKELESREEKRNVYNLSVEKYGVYYANGVLVSNCDALSDCFFMIHNVKKYL